MNHFNHFQSVSGVVLVISLLGCAAADAGPPRIRSLAKGGLSGIQVARREVVRDHAAWEKLWAEHNLTTPAALPLPEVDFSKEMVIAVTMGTKRTGGYSIEIVEAKAAGKKLEIVVHETSPPPGALTIQALTAPFHFVAVPRKHGRVEFVEAEHGREKR